MLLASGCATIRPRPDDPGMVLLPPETAGFTAVLTQAITVEHGKSQYQALVVLEVRNQSVNLAALSALGNRVLSVQWDGKTLLVEKDPSLPPDFPVELVLRDFQLAYWPEAAVRRALPARWALQADEHRRSFSHDGKEVIVIRFSQDRFADPVEFEHKELGYRLKIEQVPPSP